METNEARIEAIAQQLEASAAKEDAYFSMLFNDTSESTFIHANPAGLQLYAAELLKSSIHLESAVGSQESVWITQNSDPVIQGVLVVDQSRQEFLAQWNKLNKHAMHEETFSGKVLKTGCISIVILLLAIFVIGLQTLIKWFF